MPTIYRSHSIRKASVARSARTAGISANWRCACCEKLLGIHRDGRMHLSFARGHEYLVGFPVQATCRRCGTLNQATGPAH